MVLFVLQTFALFCTLNKFEHVVGFDINRHSEKLIQGSDVNIRDFPYYAGLHNCGATILSESWVVTAAHCVADPTSRLQNYVWVGGKSYHTSKMVAYDQVVFYDETQDSDLALLHLSEPLKFSKNIQPIDLPSEPFNDLTRSNKDKNSMATATGRGENERGEISINLQKIDVKVLSSDKCLSYMPSAVQMFITPFVSELEKYIICARRVDGRPGLCYGDSGSPLVQGNTLIGIASFIGAPCEVATLGFYVNVATFAPWIKEVAGLQ